jgi:hypothetical protein
LLGLAYRSRRNDYPNPGYHTIMKSLANQPEVVDDVMIALTRLKSPLELTLLASGMFAAARDRLNAYLRLQHPDWSDAQLHEELLRRIHGSVPRSPHSHLLSTHP